MKSALLVICFVAIVSQQGSAQAANHGEAAFPRGLILGTAIPPGGTAAIRSANGGNITIDPQGDGQVYIGRGSGTLNLRALNGGHIELPLGRKGPLSPIFSFETGLAGKVTGPAIYPWVQFTVPFDTASVQQAISDIEVDHNFGGPGWAGGRIGILANMVQTGPISDGGTLEGMQSSVTLRDSFGGTDLANGARGAATAFNPFLTLGRGFKNGVGGSGIEVDIAGLSGATFQNLTGIGIAHVTSNAARGQINDAGFQLADQGGAKAGWSDGVEFGARLGQWPIDPVSGTLIKAEFGINGAVVPSTAAYGDDYLLANFTKSAFRSKGFSVLGDGSLVIGTGLVRSNEKGITISATAREGHLQSIASTGQDWPTDGNSYYATDEFGGVYLLELSKGRVAKVTVYRTPVVEGAAPPNPVKLKPDPLAAAWGAKGLSVDLTWTSADQVRLNPGGNTIIGSGVELPRNADRGMLFVPTMNGKPTSKPGKKGEAAMIVDTRDSKLCFDWSPAGWRCTKLR